MPPVPVSQVVSSPRLWGKWQRECPVDPGNADKGSWLDCREGEAGWEIGCRILNGPCSCERLVSMNEFLGLVPSLLVIIVIVPIVIIQIIVVIVNGIDLRTLLRTPVNIVLRVRRAWGPLRQILQQVPEMHLPWTICRLWPPQDLYAPDCEATCEQQTPH